MTSEITDKVMDFYPSLHKKRQNILLTLLDIDVGNLSKYRLVLNTITKTQYIIHCYIMSTVTQADRG